MTFESRRGGLYLFTIQSLGVRHGCLTPNPARRAHRIECIRNPEALRLPEVGTFPCPNPLGHAVLLGLFTLVTHQMTNPLMSSSPRQGRHHRSRRALRTVLIMIIEASCRRHHAV